MPRYKAWIGRPERNKRRASEHKSPYGFDTGGLVDNAANFPIVHSQFAPTILALPRKYGNRAVQQIFKRIPNPVLSPHKKDTGAIVSS